MSKVIPAVRFNPAPLKGREEPMLALLITLMEQVKALASMIDGVPQTAESKRDIAQAVAEIMARGFPDIHFEVQMVPLPDA